MTAFWTAMDHSPSLHVPADVELLVRPGPAEDNVNGPMVIVRAGSYEYRDPEVDAAALDATALIDKLAKARKRIDDWRSRVRPSADPALIYLVVDDRARWKDVVTASDAARSQAFIHASVAFAKSGTRPPHPPATTADAQLEAIAKLPEGSDQAVELAHLMSRVLEPCPPANKVFRDVTSRQDRVSEMVSDMIHGLGPALIECNCKASPSDLRNILWFIAANRAPTSLIDITFDAKAPMFARSAQALWRDVGKDLAPGNVRLVARWAHRVPALRHGT